MKKKFLLFLICVAIVATSLIALVACADDKKQDGTGGEIHRSLHPKSL